MQKINKNSMIKKSEGLVIEPDDYKTTFEPKTNFRVTKDDK